MKYPPKNRQSVSRPVLEKLLRYSGRGGSVRNLEITPLKVFAMLDCGKAVFLDVICPLPGIVSLVSGEPAIEYHSHDMIVSLTPEEMVRYLANNLEPAEFFALRDHFGYNFHLLNCFYCDVTGKARQPFRVNQRQGNGHWIGSGSVQPAGVA